MARTLVASDDFNRASVGANWSQWNNYDGTMTMNSSTAIRGSTSGWYLDTMGVIWAGAGTFTTDQYSDALLAIIGNFDVNYSLGVGVRMSGFRSGGGAGTGDLRYGYLGQVIADGTANYTTRLIKIVNGNGSLIHGASVAWVAGTDRVGIEAEGNVIRMTKNGVALGGSFTTTDNDIATGNPGLIGRGSANLCCLDNWEGGNLGASLTQSTDNVRVADDFIKYITYGNRWTPAITAQITRTRNG